jgi:hypothetical protein
MIQLCACLERGPVRPTCTIPCSADVSKFWRRWPHHHKTQISFCGQHLSVVRGGENLKMLSRSCRVDAVTPSNQVVWSVPEASTQVWGLICLIVLKKHFAKILFRPNAMEEFLHFSQQADICVWVKCCSCLHHIKENNSFTVSENRDHHVSGRLRNERSRAVPTSSSATRFARRPTVLLIHRHCWAAYVCSQLFLSLQQIALSEHVVPNSYHGRLQCEGPQ